MKPRFFGITTKKNQKWATYQSEQWRQKTISPAPEEKAPAPFITISREYSCDGFPIGEIVADGLNKTEPEEVLPWAVYDKMLLEKIEEDHGIHRVLLASLTEKTRTEISDFFTSALDIRLLQSSIYRKIFTTIRALAYQGHVIIIGRGAAVATRGLKSGFHIRVYAPAEFKIKRVMEMHNLTSEKEAKTLLKKATRKREAFVRKYFKVDVNDPSIYHLMLNNADFTREEMADIILAALKISRILEK